MTGSSVLAPTLDLRVNVTLFRNPSLTFDLSFALSLSLDSSLAPSRGLSGPDATVEPFPRCFESPVTLSVSWNILLKVLLPVGFCVATDGERVVPTSTKAGEAATAADMRNERKRK